MQKLNELIEIQEFVFFPKDHVSWHACLWGDFNFSFDGILQIQVGEQKFITPPYFGLWIPPKIEHCCISIDDQVTHFVCIRIHPSISHKIAPSIKTLSLQPFFYALVKEAIRLKKIGQHSYYHHLLQVILDQISLADTYNDYLPQTNHSILAPIFSELSSVNRLHEPTSKILSEFTISERHILRLTHQEMNISIREWRDRAKILYAISQLKKNTSIKEISYKLGYRHCSSFIEFFKRHTGKTPTHISRI